jgi:hypothetical protein
VIGQQCPATGKTGPGRFRVGTIYKVSAHSTESEPSWKANPELRTRGEPPSVLLTRPASPSTSEVHSGWKCSDLTRELPSKPDELLSPVKPFYDLRPIANVIRPDTLAHVP